MTTESGRRGVPSGLSRVLVSAMLAALALGTGATTALAFGTPLPCGARTEASVFSAWGDKATYFPVSNGGVENGATDWALTGGAQVVTGNETYNVTGAGTQSLQLPPNSTAESRTVCVAAGEEVVRLFAKNPHVSGAILHVDAIVRNPTNGYIGTSSFDVNGDATSAVWAPTMQLNIPRLFNGNGTEELTLRFSLRGNAATWGIDDVFIDPFKSY
jgi:hypothetical protein